MTTTASPGRKVSSPGKQPSPQARAAAQRYATVLAGRIGMAVTRVAGLAAEWGRTRTWTGPWCWPSRRPRWWAGSSAGH